MTLTEIKKQLYKLKPSADLIKITKSGILYISLIPQETSRKEPVYFLVPLSEIGDAVFGEREKSELLIRYIIQPDTIEP